MAPFGYFLPSAPDADRRDNARRKLSLLARGMHHDGTGIDVQIHNISGTGLLLESDVKLAAGDRIEIELPHAGDITAVVIWASGRLFGCQFEGPVSPATLSAVELKSATGTQPTVDEEAPEGVRDLIDRSREQIARAIGHGHALAEIGRGAGGGIPGGTTADDEEIVGFHDLAASLRRGREKARSRDIPVPFFKMPPESWKKKSNHRWTGWTQIRGGDGWPPK